MSKATVLVIRDPDYENEFTCAGDIDIIDIDLGRAFDGPKGFRALDPDEQDE